MLKVGYIISIFRIPHKIIERNNQMSEYILETRNLVKNFGNFTAIDNVNLKDELQIISRHLKQTKFVHKQIKWSLIF